MEQYNLKPTRTVANTMPVNATQRELILEARITELSLLVERMGRSIRRLESQLSTVNATVAAKRSE